MPDFNISQFKQYVQTFIKATGIDDGNEIIETKNGELSKILSNFGLEESQIGDLLEKSDNSANIAMRASSQEQLYPVIHKDFIKASEKYEKLPENSSDVSTLTKRQIREKVALEAIDSYNKMSNSLMKRIIQPLYDNLADLPKDNTTDVNELKAKIAQLVATFVQKQHNNMSEKINQYDTAFSEYDVTYRSPFEVKQSGIVSPNMNNIADACMSQVMVKLQEFLSKDITSLTLEEYLELAKSLLDDINSLIQEKVNYIETVGNDIAKAYENDFESSIKVLQSENPPFIHWIPPLDGRIHEEEPDLIAIKGAPIEKTFTDVVNEFATGIETVKAENERTAVYDLSGRLVTKGLQPGQLYITEDGKKFIAQ